MADLITHIRDSVIGDGMPIETPFGKRPLIYGDYTASGRSLTFIEDYIREQVLPLYANTHTETSYTGAHTMRLREQARLAIRGAVNAGSDHQIIFCGSGATSAIGHLVQSLNLRSPQELLPHRHGSDLQPGNTRPVVFIGPYEHHSNELPWRESVAEVVSIPLATDGSLDIDELERQLERYADRELKIGSFCAASNVTGIKTDISRVTGVLHDAGALAFWDYAAAAPYVPIDVQGHDERTSLDAVFMSPHKFVGGPGTPGVLIVKEKLLENSVPAVPAGGTVSFVSPESHTYIDDRQRREEGGTPAIIESIRAGMVFQLKQAVGCNRIEELEERFARRALARWGRHPDIEILGNPDLPRLSIVSFRIRRQAKDLHYGFVVALLNDLFGIQARGGCSCAGPYAHRLLHLDRAKSRALERQIAKGAMVLRPGWTRLNFNYFLSDDAFEYLLRAVELIADYGWKLMPLYHYDGETGTWRHKLAPTTPTENLPDFLLPSHLNGSSMDPISIEAAPFDLGQLLQQAEELLRESPSPSTSPSTPTPTASALELDEEAESLRWFWLPQDSVQPPPSQSKAA
ncbi:MAG: aminotransferase class V-fold PLP-dependent enzyme [Pseudomonadota bacterium]